MRILLQPASGKDEQRHFEDTISNGVSTGLLQNIISAQEFNILESLDEKKIKVWGIVSKFDGNPRNEWVALQPGDIVLFYANKSFYYLAKVCLKTHNARLAKDLWGFDNENRTWEYVYFINEGKQLQIPYRPEVLGYKSNHVVRGAILLDNQKSSSMLKYVEDSLGSIIDEEIIEPTASEEQSFLKCVRTPKTPEEAEEEIKRLSEDIKNSQIKERVKKAKILVRNSRFARLTKERAEYRCEICGQKPFMQKNGLLYAEAHHKLELSISRLDNPKYMICVCPTCHRVMHYGNDEALKKRTLNRLNK